MGESLKEIDSNVYSKGKSGKNVGGRVIVR